MPDWRCEGGGSGCEGFVLDPGSNMVGSKGMGRFYSIDGAIVAFLYGFNRCCGQEKQGIIPDFSEIEGVMYLGRVSYG